MTRLRPGALGTSSIAAHTHGLAELGRCHDLSTPVPTCGEWTLADLIWHLAEVQNFWEFIITNRPIGPDAYTEPIRPADSELADALDDRCDALVGALDSAQPSEPAWSWSDDHTVAFSIRRQTHEAIVHHLDGVLAVGAEYPAVESSLAADGVAELVDVMLTGLPDWSTFAPTGESIRLISSDTDDTWELGWGRMTGTSPDSGTHYDVSAFEVLPQIDDPTTTISATAFDLVLWMWGRVDESVLTVTGDPGGPARLRAVVHESTQ